MRPTDSPFKRGLLSPSFHPFLLSLSSFSTLYNQKRRHRSSDIIHRTKKEGEEEEKVHEHQWKADRDDELLHYFSLSHNNQQKLEMKY